MKDLLGAISGGVDDLLGAMGVERNDPDLQVFKQLGPTDIAVLRNYYGPEATDRYMKLMQDKIKGKR